MHGIFYQPCQLCCFLDTRRGKTRFCVALSFCASFFACEYFFWRLVVDRGTLFEGTSMDIISDMRIFFTSACCLVLEGRP